MFITGHAHGIMTGKMFGGPNVREIMTVVMATYMFSVFAMHLPKGFGLEKWAVTVGY